MNRLTSFLSVACLFVTLFSCQSEETAPDAGKATGRIVLGVSRAEPFQETGTRATQTLTDFSGYSFQINGTDIDGNPVDRTVSFAKDGSCILTAGEYTLTADNRAAALSGTGAAYYNGTSSPFTLDVGGTLSVDLDLGKPRNVRVTLDVDPTFSTLYELTEVQFQDPQTPERTVTLTASGNAYFMPGTIHYTIKAHARKGSHAADLPAGGVQGTVSLTQEGYAHTIHLTAKAISDLLIGIDEGEHEGEFDARREHP